MTTSKSILVGVISDTHSLLRPNVKQLFNKCDVIIHAGDIGSIKVLNSLRKIAPVVAVCGNTDSDYHFSHLPKNKMIDLNGFFCYVLHDLTELDTNFHYTNTKIVISGHTHKPKIFKQNGVIYINPGSAGYRRLGCPISLSLLKISDKIISIRIVRLDL